MKGRRVWVCGCAGAWVLIAAALPGTAGWLEDAGIELHGFSEYRYGERCGEMAGISKDLLSSVDEEHKRTVEQSSQLRA